MFAITAYNVEFRRKVLFNNLKHASSLQIVDLIHIDMLFYETNTFARSYSNLLFRLVKFSTWWSDVYWDRLFGLII